ncbi:DUF6695 family protein [Polaribacter sp. HaHaR_3_91]|uniref:DUF6695 family protein n=1 Tax=Polaribacter sp. HaHaR_3_91 TaxID=2745561 RepID=UPI001C4FB9D7|nr:DUF6695 family protein [Polaribacter sp. HaHaR_3_91]QXP62638.1 hypothetical protein H0I27_12215 [Polaribacter sp. HaHaR_3_91]
MSIDKTNGIIVILSYPETIVRPAYWEPSSKVWPLIGIGSKHAVQAGHAALLLIKKDQTEINYFDFGRYITSYSNGRVRSKETDPELKVSINAEFENSKLINLKEILLWIEKHPEKTHGDGRLVASIHNEIDFEKAHNYIHQLINQKEIPYGAFIKNGTNCARFVTDAIIVSSTNKKIGKQLKRSNLLTPSPIGNVIKGNTNNSIYSVYKQQIEDYKNRSILKEYKTSFFNKFDIEPNLIGTELPNKKVFDLKDGTWLGGIGSGAWFKIERQIDSINYTISRFDSKGTKDFYADFSIDKKCFNYLEKHQFIYPTNCKEAIIMQNNKLYILQNNS